MTAQSVVPQIQNCQFRELTNLCANEAWQSFLFDELTLMMDYIPRDIDYG